MALPWLIQSALVQVPLLLMSTALLPVQSSLTRLHHLRLWLQLTSTAPQLPLFRTPTLPPLQQSLQATLMEHPQPTFCRHRPPLPETATEHPPLTSCLLPLR